MYVTGSCTHSSFSSPHPPTPPHISNSYLPNVPSPSTPGYSRSEYSIPPQECFEIDQADSTQEVKKSPVTEAGPAHPMEQVNPQHHGTYVHYTRRQSLQPSTTTYTCCLYTHHITENGKYRKYVDSHIELISHMQIHSYAHLQISQH